MKPITKGIALILLLSTLIFAPAVVFGQISFDPTITETQPNYTTNTLTIVGTGFGTTKGTVSLSGTGLVVDSWTATQIVATLPSTIVPGSYTLTVSVPVRRGPPLTATFDVTLGAVGPQGPSGPSGPIGPSGPAGAVGAIGPSGPSGPVGATGAIGPSGPSGPPGPPGIAGAVGPSGPSGPSGPIGPAGAVGAIGPSGPSGPAGATGATGATGPSGPTGPAGPTGPSGPAGPSGPSGPAGSSMGISMSLFLEFSYTCTQATSTSALSCSFNYINSNDTADYCNNPPSVSCLNSSTTWSCTFPADCWPILPTVLGCSKLPNTDLQSPSVCVFTLPITWTYWPLVNCAPPCSGPYIIHYSNTPSCVVSVYPFHAYGEATTLMTPTFAYAATNPSWNQVGGAPPPFVTNNIIAPPSINLTVYQSDPPVNASYYIWQSGIASILCYVQ